MPISIIIPTYNRINSLTRTLEYISSSSLLPQEVIVVDQTTEKALADRIHELCDKQQFNTIYLHQNEPSLTKARNRGIEIASNEIIIFMDDDVDVQPHTLYNIIKLFEDHGLAMVGGFNSWSPLQNSVIGYFFGKSSFIKRNIGHVTQAVYGRFPLQKGPNISTEWAMGFFFAVRKSCLQRWELRFDELLRYYAYAEDLDFTYAYYKRAKEEGLRCIMSDLAEVTHNCSQEYRTPTYSTTFMQVLHREYLRNKHFHNLTSRLLCAWSDFGDFVFRMLRKEKPMTVLRARRFLSKYRKDIKRGDFHYDLFMSK